MLPKFDERSAWSPRDLEGEDGWRGALTSLEIQELETAVALCQSHGVVGLEDGSDLVRMRKSMFPLPTLSRRLASIGEYIEHDRGIFMLRGVPVERFTHQELRILFFGMGLYMGTPLKQSVAGEFMQDVRDFGEPLYGDKGRGTNSKDELPWHTDRSDVVSLLCIRKATWGGESKIASLPHLYNMIADERPDLAEALCQPFPYGRAQWEPNHLSAYYELPIFTVRDGRFASRYLRHFIKLGQELPETPRLTSIQIEALDYVDARLDADDVCLRIAFEPGDLQIVNNFTIGHGRGAYENPADIEKGRYLLRLWLAVPNSRPLHESFRPLYGSVDAGVVRGGVLV